MFHKAVSCCNVQPGAGGSTVPSVGQTLYSSHSFLFMSSVSSEGSGCPGRPVSGSGCWPVSPGQVGLGTEASGVPTLVTTQSLDWAKTAWFSKKRKARSKKQRKGILVTERK